LFNGIFTELKSEDDLSRCAGTLGELLCNCDEYALSILRLDSKSSLPLTPRFMPPQSALFKFSNGDVLECKF
jgi:hypothetical protein